MGPAAEFRLGASLPRPYRDIQRSPPERKPELVSKAEAGRRARDGDLRLEQGLVDVLAAALEEELDRILLMAREAREDEIRLREVQGLPTGNPPLRIRHLKRLDPPGISPVRATASRAQEVRNEQQQDAPEVS